MQIDPRVRKRHGLDGSDGRQACVRGPGQQPVSECKQVCKGHEDKKKGNKNPDLTLNRVYARRAVLDETIERLEREKARLTPPTPRTSWRALPALDNYIAVPLRVPIKRAVMPIAVLPDVEGRGDSGEEEPPTRTWKHEDGRKPPGSSEWRPPHNQHRWHGKWNNNSNE